MRISSPSRVIPALLTNTSTGPWRSSISVNARSTASASVTSHCTPNRPSGAPLPRWVTATESPCSAKERAIASPIPRLPPVTSTDLPLEPTAPLPCRRPLSPVPNLAGCPGAHPFRTATPARPGDRHERRTCDGGGGALPPPDRTADDRRASRHPPAPALDRPRSTMRARMSRDARAAPRPCSLSQLGQHHLGRPEIDAGVGDALAVLQQLWMPTIEVLPSGDEIALHHHAANRPLTGCHLPCQVAHDIDLAQVVLLAVAVGGVDHDDFRQTSLCQLPLRVGDVGCGVVGAVLVASQDDVAGVVAGRRQLSAHPMVVDTQKLMRSARGHDGLDRGLDAPLRRVLEADDG